MRRFLLLAHRVPTGGQFTLNDLAGGGGRVDEVARVVSTALTTSNDLRRSTELWLLFVHPAPPGPRRIRVLGARVRYLHPDERSTAALIKNALVRAIPAEQEIETSPGFVVGPVDPGAALAEFARAPDALWLTESGVPIAEWPGVGDGFSAILCDPYDPTEEERRQLAASGVPPVSLGPVALRSSQCVDVLHNEFDRRAARAPPGGA
jgi:tRNA (pseudouridine54-N1)-methyltransferase